MTSATMKIQSATKGPDLSKSVVLVRLEQHSFGNSRKLKQDQYEVDGGDKSMTSANRRLLDSEELQEIKSRMAAMREYVRNQSLPFPVDGVYMVPIQKIENLIFKMNEMIGRIDEAVEAFMATYREREEETRKRNPKLYNPLDYPPERVIRSKFSCYYQLVTIGAPEQQLADRVDPAILKKARESSERLWVDAAEMTRQMQSQIMLELVGNLRKNLTDDDRTGKPKRFSNSTLDNLTAFMRDFESAANVTDHKQLAALVAEGKKLLNGTTTEMLKDNAMLRAEIKKDFAVIEKALVPMVGERKVRRGEE